MINKNFLLIVLAGTLMLAACGQESKSLDCQESADLSISGSAVSPDFVARISSLLGPTPNVDENQMREAAQQVRIKFPKASQDEIVDLLAAAYCPSIDPHGMMSRAEQDTVQSGFVDTANRIVSGDTPGH